VHLLTYLLTYLLRPTYTVVSGREIKGNISETVEDRAKVAIITAYRKSKSYTDFRLRPKCMTLNDIYERDSRPLIP